MQGARYLMMVLIVCSLGLTAMAGKKNVETTNSEIEGTGNLSKLHREELVAKIGKIKEFLQQSPDTNAVQLLSFAADLEKEVRNKKFGLVFEEHKERVDIELEENLPVLTENKERLIDNGGEVNFLIEGDNLAALKLLEKTHRGKIDVIYIDPPYNTGNKDFVYNDSFVDVNDGYRHSKWLSFMRKRLELARNLLSKTGVVFISLDDNEQHNARLLCDAIFGEKMFCGQFIWHKKSGGGQTDDYFVTEHEYVLVYRKTDEFQWLDEYIESKGSYNHEDEHGRYKAVKLEKWGSSAHKEDRLTMWYSIKDPDGKNMYPVAPDGLPGRWRVGDKRMKRLEQLELIEWKKTSDRWVPYEKIYEEGTPVKKIKERSILFDIEETGDASKMLTAIFGKKDVFSNPKPVELLEVLIEHCQSSIVLDFFAGSGTTGHAVMKLNAEDGGKRKFILVTNNENEICEKVTYERLKRVIEKENYAAKLKYYKIDYVPIKEQMYYEYADDLLAHIRELVELENGVDFTHDSEIAIVLTDDEIEKLSKNASKIKKIKTLYRGHNVMMSKAIEEKLKGLNIEIKVIPQYYYPELEG